MIWSWDGDLSLRILLLWFLNLTFTTLSNYWRWRHVYQSTTDWSFKGFILWPITGTSRSAAGGSFPLLNHWNNDDDGWVNWLIRNYLDNQWNDRLRNWTGSADWMTHLDRSIVRTILWSETQEDLSSPWRWRRRRRHWTVNSQSGQRSHWFIKHSQGGLKLQFVLVLKREEKWRQSGAEQAQVC